jgi:hypothetical protein
LTALGGLLATVSVAVLRARCGAQLGFNTL